MNASVGWKQLAALGVAAVIALGVLVAPTAAQSELCFTVPGVNACVSPEFRDFWEKNGGLATFGYPIEASKQENGFTVQYFERQRLELHPETAAPYNVQIGRVNNDALVREGRDWTTFPKETGSAAGCVEFSQTSHSVCGEFLRFWKAKGLDLGQPGVSQAESLALWGLPLSQPAEELNPDGNRVMVQHFERARFEMPLDGAKTIALTRIGVELVPLKVKILAVNDFHGQLSAGRKVAGKDVGSAAVLATYLQQRRAQVTDSVLVHAGDMVGASPLVSALFNDQPSVEFMNMMNFTVGTPGNHEFDKGTDFLQKQIAGENFPYVNANIFYKESGKLVFPPYKIVTFNGARVAFIGAVLKDTPTIVNPAGITNLEFRDEADSINAVVPELQAQGIRAMVVLIHQGGVGQSKPTDTIQGSIVDIAKRLNPEIDVIVAGHTHQFNNAVVAGKLITQAFSYSTAFADISVTIDRATGDITDRSADIVTTFADGVTPDPAVAALTKKYEDQAAPIANRQVATAATALPYPPASGGTGESALGNLIADSQRVNMGTQFAFMNPGGIRAPLAAGPVTYGALFTIQPFGNNLVRMNYTGDQVYALLNQQWQPQADGTTIVRILQPSGLAYTFNDSQPIGQRIIEIRGPDGKPIDRAATYSVEMNSFLADGGDGFTVFRQGTNRQGGAIDVDAFVDYVSKLPQPFAAPDVGRIVKQ